MASSPVPAAPPEYEEPIWRHDTIDALVVIDRNRPGFGPLDGREPTHPIDRLAISLEQRLQVLMNISTYLATTDEIRYEEDIPTQIWAVVTNDPAYAEWCRSWGGNLVQLSFDEEANELVVEARDQSHRYASDELSAAVALVADEVERPAEDAPGPGLTQSVPSEAATLVAALEWALAFNRSTIRALDDENSARRRQIEAANRTDYELRIELEALRAVLRSNSEHLEAARRKPSLRRRIGWLLLGGAITFAGQVGATVAADLLVGDEPPRSVTFNGDIDESSIVMGDVIGNTCSIAIALNGDISQSVQALPFVSHSVSD